VYVALKSEAPAAWAYAKSVFKALTGNDLRFVRTDSDSIFMSQEMKDMFVEAGVIATFSSPNDHAQNGYAEVSVKYANRGTKTYMTHSSTPSFLWVEADRCRVHMHNHVAVMKDEATGKYISRYAMMRGNPTLRFDPELFMPFGAKAVVRLVCVKVQKQWIKTRDGPEFLLAMEVLMAVAGRIEFTTRIQKRFTLCL